MGINYSKVMCADEKNVCRYGEPIPQKIYADNVGRYITEWRNEG